MSNKAPARILWLEDVDSTMNEARRRVGEALPFWVAARHQHAGRGTKGRVWFDAPDNLKTSYLFCPQRPQAAWPQASLVAALGLRDALLAWVACDDALCLKWPNDVLLNERKIAGILLETMAGPDGPLLAIGLGVNLAAHPAADALRPGGWPVTDVKTQTGHVIPPAEFLHRLAGAIQHRIEQWQEMGFDPIRQDWLAACYGLGQHVTAQSGGHSIAGVLHGVDGNGHLCLETDRQIRSYPSAELTWNKGLQSI